MAEELTFLEIGRQTYLDCCFAAGLVEGHPVDTIYLKMKRDADDETTTILLRKDEALSIVWLLSGALCSDKSLSQA